jgi:predicted acetylornithine/succinylornithine family transaminase
MTAPAHSTSALVDSIQHTISLNYGPRPVVMDRGEGVYLYDLDGNAYLDFVAGIAVCALGYGHPGLTAALQQQVGKLLHASNMFISEPQAQLQQRLVDRSFADRVYLCNSGTEANEAAFKLARRFQKKVRGQATQTRIIAALKSFHGRTYGSLAATGQPKYWDGFEPMPADFAHVPFNDIDALRAAVDEHTAAVILEPVQGEGGIFPATTDYLVAAREACDRVGAVLIFDEVQCGVGRTGTLWAHEHAGVTPDIMTLAKGIGGGVPLGAMLSTEAVAQGFTKGSHASTYGGNPLAACAGVAVLDAVDNAEFLASVRARGERLMAGLRALQATHPIIRDVRGVGLLIGAEVNAEQVELIVAAARAQGLIVNSTGGNTLRFAPPLLVTDAHVDDALARLERALAGF